MLALKPHQLDLKNPSSKPVVPLVLRPLGLALWLVQRSAGWTIGWPNRLTLHMLRFANE